MSDETQDSARQLERVPFRHSLAEVDEIQNPYFIGAPGMNRTCDLRFRKPLLYPLSFRGKGVPLVSPILSKTTAARFFLSKKPTKGYRRE